MFCRTLSLWLQFREWSNTRSIPLKTTRKDSEDATVWKRKLRYNEYVTPNLSTRLFYLNSCLLIMISVLDSKLKHLHTGQANQCFPSILLPGEIIYWTNSNIRVYDAFILGYFTTKIKIWRFRIDNWPPLLNVNYYYFFNCSFFYNVTLVLYRVLSKILVPQCSY